MKVMVKLTILVGVFRKASKDLEKDLEISGRIEVI